MNVKDTKYRIPDYSPFLCLSDCQCHSLVVRGLLVLCILHYPHLILERDHYTDRDEKGWHDLYGVELITNQICRL